MDLFGSYCLLMTITASLLIMIYSVTLWHNWRGSNFKFIYLIVGILTLNNLALLAFAFADYKIFAKDDIKPSYVWILSLAGGGSDLALCVSHILLALKYR